MQRIRRIVVATVGAVAGVALGALAGAPGVVNAWKW